MRSFIKMLLPICALALCGVLFLTLSLGSAKRLVKQTDALPKRTPARVLIDAGHGGEDGGAVVGDEKKKEINLAVTRDVADLLTVCGFDVALTRSGDEALSLEGDDIKKRKYNDMKLRLELYNSPDVDAVISIHQNKFSDSASHGAQVFFSPNREESEFLAECLKTAVKEMLQPDNTRECKRAGSEIFLLKNAKNPAVLVECGFLSNRAEREKLLTDGYQKQLALAVVTGFLDYYQS